LLHTLVKQTEIPGPLFSHLSNRLDQNKTEHTLTVGSHAQCIIRLSLSCILYPFT